jgi:hypothetical protein
MSVDSRKLHTVKYGTPNIGANTPVNKIPTYMEDQRGVLGPYDPKDSSQVLNQELLQIISRGINDIVDTLKLKLGNNFTESNQSANDIKRRLDDLKKEIDADILKDLPPDLNSISIDPNNNYEVITGDGYLRPIDSKPQISVSDINIANDYNFNRLNDEHRPVVLNGYDQSELYGVETEFTDPVRLDIENRLKNCQNLEFLYLKKHDEIMKTFAFTINLFDKYKYAIKIVLLLLKSLVYKDPETDIPPPPPPPPGTPRVRIPIPIIPNIKKLLLDQKNIQGVINKMKTVISPDNNTPPDIILEKADANLKVQKLTDRTVPEENVSKYIRPQVAPKPVLTPPGP